MKLATRLTAVLAVVALAASANVASAFSLRAPQVAFSSSTLQGYLTAWDGGISATSDQLDAQAFSTGITGNTDFTLILKTAAGAAVGVYNTLAVGSPALYQLFPAAAVSGYSVACHFTSTGTLQATLFDENNVNLGTTTYTSVDRTHFGFYISGPNGTWYSQDGRNGNQAQVLTYAGTVTGGNYGEWFECFEDAAYNASTSTFTGAVVVLQSVQPVPVRAGTWGALKASYR